VERIARGPIRIEEALNIAKRFSMAASAGQFAST
jgi:hypothetical protein